MHGRSLALIGLLFLTLVVAGCPSQHRESTLRTTPAEAPRPPAPETEAVSSAAQRLELLGRWYHGPVFDSAVSGNHIYFGSGGVIRVLRLDDRLTDTGR